MDKNTKKELIEFIAHNLDITPDMYNRAQSVVGGLGNYLINIEPTASVYKQGSFRLGTIVRPYKRDRDGEFDIDIVVQSADDKDSTHPRLIKTRLGERLRASSYRTYLDDEGGRCWTLNYIYNDGSIETPFHVDLLPCVAESNIEKQKIDPIEYRDTAIAITHILDKASHPYQYAWRPSNPNGFAKWFDKVNYGKYATIKANDRHRVFASYRGLFASAEAVGDDYTRSPLQMVIQILKRHRDVMYANKEIADFKPISIIVTTLVGKIVETNNIVENNTYELLNLVLKGLDFYSKLLTSGIDSDFADDFKSRRLIVKRMDKGFAKWFIANPADSKENLANRWNDDSRYVSEFFRWVKKATSDLIDILDGSLKPAEIIAKLKYCLGEEIGNALSGFSFTNEQLTKPIIITTTTPKPYGE